MDIILYKVLDSANTVNKVLENGLTISVNLKSDIDVSRMTLRLSNIDDILRNRFNYIHIPLLNRFYFINSVNSVHNSIVELDCGVDLLMTYKNELLNSKARLKRNIKTGDYVSFNNTDEIFTTITKLVSDKSLTPNTHNKILTTVGL